MGLLEESRWPKNNASTVAGVASAERASTDYTESVTSVDERLEGGFTIGSGVSFDL